MNNIEKIRQEIERRKEICEGIFERESDTYYQGKAVAYGELLSFIDSLPEEKPSDDLEKAAGRLGFDYVDNIVHESPGHRWNDHDVEFGYRDGFIAGAKWQKAKDDEETADLFTIVALDAAQRAREELVMKYAVEGEIGYWNQSGLSIRLDQSLERLGYDMDTKVKIIIVKQ